MDRNTHLVAPISRTPENAAFPKPPPRSRSFAASLLVAWPGGGPVPLTLCRQMGYPSKQVTAATAARPQIEKLMPETLQSTSKPPGGISTLVSFVDAQIAIVGAAGMDERLEGALLSKLRPLSREMKARLFDGYGPLANFAAKIDMAYALEIIPNDIYETLRNINRVRVAFAHPKTVISFSDPKVVEILNNLGIDTATPGVSGRYLTKLTDVDTYLKGQTAPEHLTP